MLHILVLEGDWDTLFLFVCALRRRQKATAFQDIEGSSTAEGTKAPSVYSVKLGGRTQRSSSCEML